MKTNYLLSFLTILFSITYSLHVFAQYDTVYWNLSDTSTVKLTGDWEYGTTNKSFDGLINSAQVGVVSKLDTTYGANDTSNFELLYVVEKDFAGSIISTGGLYPSDIHFQLDYTADLDSLDTLRIQARVKQGDWFDLLDYAINMFGGPFNGITFSPDHVPSEPIEIVFPNQNNAVMVFAEIGVFFAEAGYRHFHNNPDSAIQEGDSIYFRMSLESDTITPNKDGVLVRSVGLTGYVPPPIGIEMITESHLAVYPNPTQGELIVTLEEEQELLLHSLDGRILKHYNGTIGENRINLSNLASGVYWLKANTSYAKILKH